MSNGHIHAEAMMEYALECSRDDKAYKNWQFKLNGKDYWSNLNTHPGWCNEHQYRRRPMTVDIDSYSVPVPVMHEDEMTICQTYYVPAPNDPDGFMQYRWDGNPQDILFLNRRLIYTHPEGALKRYSEMVNRPATQINKHFK